MEQVWPELRPIGAAELEELYRFPDAPGRPWVTASFVRSLDGAVEVGGRSAPLSDAADRQVYRLQSDLADVVLLGAGTAVGEGFTGIHPDAVAAERRRRHGLAPVPPVAVVSSGPSLPPDAPVITEALVPTLVLTGAATPAATRDAWRAAGAEVLVAGEAGTEPRAAVAALAARGLRRVDCEGGPRLFGSLAAAGLVDELRLTLSPLLAAGESGRIAAGAAPVPLSGARLVSVLAEGDTLLLRYHLATGGVST